MFKYMKLRLFTLVSFLLILPVSGNLWAQEAANILLKGIKVESNQSPQLMSIEFSPDMSKLSHITIDNKGVPTLGFKLLIPIPDSAYGQDIATKQLQSFPSGILEKVEIREVINRNSDAIDSLGAIELKVTLRELSQVKLQSPENSILRLSILPMSENIKSPKTAEQVKNNTGMLSLEKMSDAQPDSVTAQQALIISGQVDSRIKEKVSLYSKPTYLNISILNASGKYKRAINLSRFLKQKKTLIEKKLGVRFEVLNISNAPSFDYEETTIYFKRHFLKSALYLARLLPGNQKITPMPGAADRHGIDIEIFIGKDYR